MITERLKRLLLAGRIKMDGAMGTELLARGLKLGEAAEAWCVTRPGDVSAVHRAYVEAGAEALLTNTFGAHASLLAARGCDLGPESIAAAAVRLAREAAGADGLVVGDVGPALAPGQGTFDERVESLRPLVAALVREDIDILMFESIRDRRDPQAVVRVRDLEAPGVPMIVCATFLEPAQEDPFTLTTLAQAVRDHHPAFVGANCTEVDRAGELGLVDEVAPVCMRPSGGLPGTALSPAEWARKVLGRCQTAVFVGGCCGTTPAHIAALGRLNSTWRM